MAEPYSVSASDIIEVRYLMTYQNQKCMYVLHYQPTPDSVTQIEGVTFIQHVADHFSIGGAGTLLGRLKDATVTSMFFDRVEAQKIHTTRWAKRISTISQTGIQNTAGAPSNLAADFTKRTDRARTKNDPSHRGGVGTLHFVGIPLSQVEGNALNGDYVLDVLTPLSVALNSIEFVAPVNLQPVIYHRRATAAPYATLIQTTTPEDYVRTMRRRGALLGQ